MIDPILLKRAVAQRDTIEWDKPCRKCKYSLRGLKRSGTCPECGTPIDPDAADPTLSPIPGTSSAKRKTRILKSVMDLSWADLIWLGRSTTLVAWGINICGIIMIAVWVEFLSLQHWWESTPGPGFAALLIAASIAAAFVVPGAFMLTHRAGAGGGKVHGHEVKATYRQVVSEIPEWVMWLSRILTPLLSLGFLFGAAAIFAPDASVLRRGLEFLAPVCVWLGLCGMGALSRILMDVAYVVGDDLALNRCHMAVFSIPLFGFFLAGAPVWGPLGGFDQYFSPITVSLFGLFISIVPIMWVAGLLSLAKACRWATTSVIQDEEKHERMLDRAARQSEKINRQMNASGNR